VSVPYRPRPDPVSIIPTAERLAVAVATAAKRGELTEGEHFVAVAVGAHFGYEHDELSRQVSEMRAQIEQLQRLLLELYRESAQARLDIRASPVR
jgi:hypothetical protein